MSGGAILYQRVMRAGDSQLAIRGLWNRDLRKLIRHTREIVEIADEVAETILAEAMTEATVRFMNKTHRKNK